MIQLPKKRLRRFFGFGEALSLYTFAMALMHLAQAKTRLPPKRAHCKLGYRRTFWVGLNFPRSFTNVQPIDDFLAQIVHILLAIT